MADTSAYCGTFKYESSENIEAYYKAVGIAIDEPTLAASNPTITISIAEDGTWTSDYVGAPQNMTEKFKLGEEAEIEYMGIKMKQTTTQEGSGFATVTNLPDGKVSKSSCEFTADGCSMIMEMDGIKATLKMKRA